MKTRRILAVILSITTLNFLISTAKGQVYSANAVGYFLFNCSPGALLAGQLELNGQTWANAGPVGSPMILSNEAIHHAGSWHRFQRDARLPGFIEEPIDGLIGWLRVGNIGSRGQDGVRTELAGADALDVTLDPVDLKWPNRRLRITPEGKAGAVASALANLALAGSSNGCAPKVEG
jgi:hypothetical protein